MQEKLAMSSSKSSAAVVPTVQPKGKTRIVLRARRAWLAVADLQIHPEAQRRLNRAWVKAQVPNFDIEALGLIVVGTCNDVHYVIDGQHRVELIREVGWGDQNVECEVYDDMTLPEMAHEFLIRNRKINIRTFDKFRIRVTADEAIPVAIGELVIKHGLVLSDQSGATKNVSAVVAMEKIYRGAGMTGAEKHGAAALDRALGIIVDAWDRTSASLAGAVIEGIGLMCLRYGTKIDVETLVKKLSVTPGGPPGLIGRGRGLRDLRGGTVAYCLAGAVTEIYNRGRRVGKLESWWK